MSKDKWGDGTPQWEFMGDRILQLVFSLSSGDLLTALDVSRVSSINWTLAFQKWIDMHVIKAVAVSPY